MEIQNQSTYYTLITGASMGIGKSLAYECARRKMNLILVALPGNELETLTQSLTSNYGVLAHNFAIDLTEEDAPEKIYNWCRERNFKVNVLINNAGLGASGNFETIDLKRYLIMMKLNNQALVGLTHYFIPELKENGPAYILNTSSLEAFLPSPYKSVYTGTKSFTFAFTLALREELRSAKISVSVLCPGPVVTNRDGMSRIKSQGKKARLIVMMPNRVAKLAIKKMLAGKGIIVPGYGNVALTRILRFIPRLARMRIMEQMMRVYTTLPQKV